MCSGDLKTVVEEAPFIGKEKYDHWGKSRATR
jgi:hypothetical protein